MLLPISGNGIIIKNVICNDKELCADAKYLYGIIDYWANIEGKWFNHSQPTMIHTTAEICEYLNITDKTFKKYLNQLEKKGYITYFKIGHKYEIKPLINDTLILEEQAKIKYANLERKKQEKQNEIDKLNKDIKELYEIKKDLYTKEDQAILEKFIQSII